MSVERDLRRDMLKRRAEQDKRNAEATKEFAAQHEEAVKLSEQMDAERAKEAEASTKASAASAEETQRTSAKKAAERVAAHKSRGR